MSDYTPTTEEVRNGYSIADGGLNDTWLREDAENRFDRWLAEELRKAKNDAWFEGFSAGWDECDDPEGFVNDKWDAKTPNPYREGETE
jgi:hypothetical protein